VLGARPSTKIENFSALVLKRDRVKYILKLFLKGRIKKRLKGLFKTPLFYFGLFLFILIIFCNLAASFFFKGQAAFLMPLKNDNNSQKDDPFLSQKGALSLVSPEINLVQENSLDGFSLPQSFSPQVLGALLGQDLPQERKEIIDYVVQEGDTLKSIAQKFEISLETLLWANNLTKNSKIKIGENLVVLPVSGTVHIVKNGDTISEIAKTYKASVDEIIAFNELFDGNDIYISDILIIPNGTMPSKPQILAQTPLPESYFIFPTTGKITQGLHWYNAVDIANKCGTPIYAAAAGEVLKVKYGWNMGMGNYLTILHSAGIVTTYAHLSWIFVNPGEPVALGQKIALMGYSGHTIPSGSAGCHLHFGVTGAKNFLAKYLVGTYIKY